MNYQRIHEEKKPLKCSKCYRSVSISGKDSWKDSHWRQFIELLKCGKSFSGSRDLKYHYLEDSWRETIQVHNMWQELLHILRWRFIEGLTSKKSQNVTWTSAYQITPFKYTKYPPESVNVNILCAVHKWCHLSRRRGGQPKVIWWEA